MTRAKTRRPSTQILTYDEREAQRRVVLGAREDARRLLRRRQLSQSDFGHLLRPKRSGSLIDKLERGAARLQPGVSRSITELLQRLSRQAGVAVPDAGELHTWPAEDTP